ncbi:MAG: hypothetical protein U9N50_08875 [Pseudomonadota bacterium]|nr:hypothetical protein [Pseudomonadota bacterium]
MIILSESVKTWGSPGFEKSFKAEVGGLDAAQLSLQQGLTQSSYVSESDFTVVILNANDTVNNIHVKAGIFYAGVNAGSCCADDPTPLNEQTEYCEMQFEINKSTAKATIKLLQDI